MIRQWELHVWDTVNEETVFFEHYANRADAIWRGVQIRAQSPRFAVTVDELTEPIAAAHTLEHYQHQHGPAQ